ncbi:MAG: dihydropteroate synthase [Thermoplasmata archaeon]
MFKTRVLSLKGIEKELRGMRCDPRGVEIMSPKAEFRLVRARGLDPRGANILKQECLAAGAEAAVSWAALSFSEEKSEVIMMATLAQYGRVLRKLKEQPFDLPVLASEIERALEYFDDPKRPPMPGSGTRVMGILNVTPDSFYDGGRYTHTTDAVQRGLAMVQQGADIIDIGGESTRPGSRRLSVEEEAQRVVPVIEKLSRKTDVRISVDTHDPSVAEEAVDAGASMINDVYGLRAEGMTETAASLDVPVVIMHMQGTPETMQKDPHYDDVIGEIYGFLKHMTLKAEDAGVSPDNIIIDPGIGFGKKLVHNLEIISRLEEFNSMGYPVLLGASRKSFLGEILGKEAEERLYGSLGIAAVAVQKKVGILRVHDVKETLDVVRSVQALKHYK